MSKYRGTLQEKTAAALERRKIPFLYETTKLNYVVKKAFKPEFIIERDERHTMYVMCYATLTNVDRAEIEIVLKQYPTIDLRIIFTNACAKIPETKMSYAEWADSQGIEWYMAHTISDIGKILKRWHNE